MLLDKFKLINTLLLILLKEINAGIMHSNTHEINKERESDGAYSPRDSRHYDEGGNHIENFDHEAILGSHREAEEFDQLEPEEAKRRLVILLKKMDLTNDKHIDRNELKAWILRSFKMLSEEEAEERLKEVDENNDGIATWKEYMIESYGLDENFDVTFDLLQTIEADRILWNASDKNHDGKLDKLEWPLFSHPEEHPEMFPIILKQTLIEKDMNSDGALNFTEYMGKRGSEVDKETLSAEKDKFDEELDKNKDGKLTGDEILTWVVPDNEDIAEEEVEHLVSHCDDNDDGLLGFEEILNHYHIFVGSEVTDYGEHLHNVHRFSDEL